MTTATETKTETKVTWLSPSEIRIDGGTQSREGINEETVREYADAMRNGAQFPPVVVFYDGHHYWLGDGFHRWKAAHVQIVPPKLLADVRQGTQRDAVLHSVGANATHGLPRTRADKRRAVETLLRDEVWGQWSNSEIARRTGTSHTFVAKVRDVLTCNVAGENGNGNGTRTYTTKHGTQAVMQTDRIGQGQRSDINVPDPAAIQKLTTMGWELIANPGTSARHYTLKKEQALITAMRLDDVIEWLNLQPTFDTTGTTLLIGETVLLVVDLCHGANKPEFFVKWRKYQTQNHNNVQDAVSDLLEIKIMHDTAQAAKQPAQAVAAEQQHVLCRICGTVPATIMTSSSNGVCDSCHIAEMREREQAEQQRQRQAIIGELSAMRRAVAVARQIERLAQEWYDGLRQRESRLGITDDEIDGYIVEEEEAEAIASEWLGFWLM